MKTTKYILSTAVAVLLFTSSCKKGYFTDVNESDNLPLDVPCYALLPSAQGNLAFAQGGDASRYTSVFIQQVTGGARQFASYDRYSFTENNFDNLWRLNLYAGPMMDLNIILGKAKAGGFVYYQGIAEVMMAYSLGLTSDMWGDIPYSEAFQGSGNLQPKFDSQASIYTSIGSLLDDAITQFGKTDASAQQPGGDDLIFGGDVALWTSFANGLKARFAIHLTKLGVSHAQDALTAIAAGALTSNADDVQFKFSIDEVGANPWYQYIRDRDDIIYDGYGVQSMISKNDPRYGVFIDTADVYWGTGYIGPYFAAPDAPIALFSYAEQKFIEAEAKLRTGDDAGAQTALGEAISASMDKAGVATADDAAYQLANVSWTGTFDNKLATIMYEKYIALFTQPEAWTDWRRTGYPVLTPNPSGVISGIPRRFIYPNSERLYNSNCPQSSNLLTPRLWWDQ
ncbi:MAG: SusD/RagB family nutrient-binding outer membrane lipoprotein [Bacteroidetes bacterium]|nr:SusD/RagB family nutrient-binding outer membrane lipoprotein [Bacteroidota bacterium]